MAEKSAFTKIHHIGVVVRDLDKAIKYYESLGIGPFESMKLPGEITEQTVYGKSTEFELKSAVTKIGSVELELIQPIKGAAVQEDFLKSKGEGINHIGFKVEDFEKEKAKLVKKGFNAILYRNRSSGIKTAYFDTDKVGGVMMEVFQPPTK